MNRQTERKIILVKRKTRLDDLISRFNTIPQARFYVEHLGADFSDYEAEHTEYEIAVRRAIETMTNFGRVHVLDRSYLPNFIFGADDIVVAIGQDGMVANTLKYLDNQPLVGINPSPRRWDGVLLPFIIDDLETVIPDVLNNNRPCKEVTMAKASLSDGQSLLAVNDLFIGQKTHISSRYQLTHGDKTEFQSSSGIIISTGLGSTGWFRSIMAGAKGVVNSVSDINGDIDTKEHFSWDSNFLYYCTREPFPSKTTGISMIFGKITNKNPLQVLSQMPENGVIFSDGIENDFLEFNSGIEAKIDIAENRGILIA